ncbi:hypothetical protein [Thauera sp. 28]|uniref:hypothetical protein n=1 Tax=Thauera sp. 28 TaxID=303682 RepID=UPI0012F99EF6|nr:hypothetical protein [Thauera sp. 28]
MLTYNAESTAFSEYPEILDVEPAAGTGDHCRLGSSEIDGRSTGHGCRDRC